MAAIDRNLDSSTTSESTSPSTPHLSPNISPEPKPFRRTTTLQFTTLKQPSGRIRQPSSAASPLPPLSTSCLLRLNPPFLGRSRPRSWGHVRRSSGEAAWAELRVEVPRSPCQAQFSARGSEWWVEAVPDRREAGCHSHMEHRAERPSGDATHLHHCQECTDSRPRANGSTTQVAEHRRGTRPGRRPGPGPDGASRLRVQGATEPKPRHSSARAARVRAVEVVRMSQPRWSPCSLGWIHGGD